MKSLSPLSKESIALTDPNLAIFARAYNHIPESAPKSREGASATQRIRDIIVALFGGDKEQNNLNLAEEKR